MSIWEKVRTRAEQVVANAVSSSRATLSTRRDLERDYLRNLPKFSPADWQVGVLLADQIERFSVEFKLIDPFRAEKLRPAGYELSVGEYYSKGDEVYHLEDKPGKNKIIVEPFEVIIVQILERLNMPEFMIARWNVAVGQAYQGFLWVGAAQVDPGFCGYLCCPIYNLSDKPRELGLGESLAVIDFVGTTAPNDHSRKYRTDFTKRKRILFDDYGKIQSALTTQAKDRLDKVENDMVELRSTVFNSTAIIFAAIGTLVTALALFVSNAIPQTTSRFSPPLLISAAALVVSMFSVVVSFTKAWWKRTILAASIVISLVLFLYWYAGKYAV